jgi:ferredoxin--NADP+ reductase
MREISDEFYVTTDDGSCGVHGFVTNVLGDLIQNDRKIDLVFAVGPVPMMKFVSKTTEAKKIPTLVSLNSIMVDGTGICGACRVSVDGQMKFACVDGPEFDGHKVDFQELMGRLNAYRTYEAESDKRWTNQQGGETQ